MPFPNLRDTVPLIRYSDAVLVLRSGPDTIFRRSARLWVLHDTIHLVSPESTGRGTWGAIMTITCAVAPPTRREPRRERFAQRAHDDLRRRLHDLPGRLRARALADPVVLVVLMPLLSLALFAAKGQPVEAAPTLYGLIIVPTVAIATVLMYASWRISPHVHRGWVSAAVTTLGVHSLTALATQVLRPDLGGPQFWVAAAGLACIAGLVALAVPASRRPVPCDPVLLGFAAGAALTVARVTTAVVVSHVDPPTPGRWVGGGVLLLLIMLGCASVWRLKTPTWKRVRMSAVLALLASGSLVLHLAGDASWGPWTVIVGHTLCSVVIASTTVAALRLALAEDGARVEELNARLEQAEAGHRTEQAVHHEISATLAGISSATRLIHSPRGVTDQRRQRLEDMVEAELARLSRLLDPTHTPADDQPRSVDVDEVVATLALSQEARGNSVQRSPSGLRVDADPDAVAEILNILLDNAAKHGGRESVVEVSEHAAHVEIAVSNGGRGVAPEVRERLFHWGARGHGSRGQGIGLPIARELAQHQGGYLHLRETNHERTTFVVGLRAGGAVR